MERNPLNFQRDFERWGNFPTFVSRNKNNNIMEKHIETFTATLFGVQYTLLNVMTNAGYSVGVAPRSLEDVIYNALENDSYHLVEWLDNKYGYVLEDETFADYLENGNVDDIYYHLNDIEDETIFEF